MPAIDFALNHLTLVLVCAAATIAFLSCQIPLRRARENARCVARQFQVHSPDGVMLLDASKDAYFLLVTEGQGVPYSRRLSAERAKVVSSFIEWKPISASAARP